jgi:hypothetical protein
LTPTLAQNLTTWANLQALVRSLVTSAQADIAKGERELLGEVKREGNVVFVRFGGRRG